MDFSTATFLALAGTAAAAGWIDAVVGGGGLILIPVLLAVAPDLAPAAALATNKAVAVCGTSGAAFTMNRSMIRQHGRQALPGIMWLGVAIAAGCAAVGASLAHRTPAELMRPVIICLMLAVGLFIFFKPQFGQAENQDNNLSWRKLIAVTGAVVLIAAYDGFFGPGTGMFLIFALTALWTGHFVRAAAWAKLLNTGTNLGALCVFLAAGLVNFHLAVPLAIANIFGAQIGARTVLSGGTKFVRFAVLAVVIVMCSYLGWQQWTT